MPKEVIESRYAGVTAVQADSSGASEHVSLEATRLHIGWTKDHDHLEVAVLNQAVESQHPGDPAPGWYVQLDRAGVNRAIHTLRKARDAAFGADA